MEYIKRRVTPQWERVVRLSYRARNVEPFWHYVLNNRSRRVWKEHASSSTRNLSSLQADLIGALKRDGIVAVHPKDLFADGVAFSQQLLSFAQDRLHEPKNQAEIAEYKNILAKRLSVGEKKDKMFKDFRVNLWNIAPNATLDLDNPFARLVLSDEILEIVGGYLDLAPRFANGGMQTTILVPPGTPEYLSQRWHRDPEDKKFIRLFMYLSDVEQQGAGPFTYIKGSQYGGKWRNVFPQSPPAGRYPPNGEIEKVIPKGEMTPYFAKAGTILLADTSGLHRGGYSTTIERLSFSATYFSDAALHDKTYKTSSVADKLDSFSPLTRYALS